MVRIEYQSRNYRSVLWISSDLFSCDCTSLLILGIFDLEKIENNHTVNPGCIPLTLLCDNVKDPGNMGSLLRCAAAVGCDQFITTKGNTKKNR